MGPRASAEKFPGGGNGKKTENSTIDPLPRGTTEKRPKNSTIKPLSTVSVPSKIQGDGTASNLDAKSGWIY